MRTLSKPLASGHEKCQIDPGTAAPGARDATLIILRDIPAIAEIERLERGQGAWLTEAEIDERAQRVSLSLFGITRNDTWGPTEFGCPVTQAQFDVQQQRPDDWEDGFEELQYVQKYGYDTTYVYKLTHYLFEEGFDCTDGAGESIRCLARFARQLICVIDELLPEAVFTPDGSGGVKVTAERWAAALEADARRFRRK